MALLYQYIRVLQHDNMLFYDENHISYSLSPHLYLALQKSNEVTTAQKKEKPGKSYS